MRKKIVSVFLVFVILLMSFPLSAFAEDDTDIFSSLYKAERIDSDSYQNFYVSDSEIGVCKVYKLKKQPSAQYYEICLDVASDNKNVVFNVVNNVDFESKKYNTLFSKVADTTDWKNVFTATIRIPAGSDTYFVIKEKDIKTPDYLTDTENTLSVYSHKHIYKSSVSNNIKKDVCKTCGFTRKYQTVTNIKLSFSSCTYSGNKKTPKVIAKNSKGQTISSSYYSVKRYGNRTNVGKYKVVVTMNKYPYYGKKTLYFTIKPPTTAITKVKVNISRKHKTVNLKWKKKKTQVSGYQIEYSTSKNFKNSKRKTVSKKSANNTTIKNLSSKKQYWFRIRTYKTVKINGKSQKIYSSWSNTKIQV